MISLALFGAYCAVFFIRLSASLVFIQFVVGSAIGFWLIYVDRLIHALFLAPEQDFSRLVREQWDRRSFSGVARLLYHAEGIQQGLTTRSVLFLFAYLVLAVFVMTSTGSLLGSSMILGMGLRYSLDMFTLMDTPETFAQQFLSQVKHSFRRSDIRMMTAMWIVGFILVSFIAWM